MGFVILRKIEDVMASLMWACDFAMQQQPIGYG
jgi:hypothetical protein